MNKTELANAMAAKTGMTKTAAKEAMNACLGFRAFASQATRAFLQSSTHLLPMAWHT